MHSMLQAVTDQTKIKKKPSNLYNFGEILMDTNGIIAGGVSGYGKNIEMHLYEWGDLETEANWKHCRVVTSIPIFS